MGMFDWTEKPGAVLQQGGVIAPDAGGPAELISDDA